MPKIDWLLDYIRTGMKAYELGQTVPPSSIYNYIIDEYGNIDVDGMHRMENRKTLLDHGIDIKYQIIIFLNHLENNHGTKRADRFREWIETGNIAGLSHHQRLEIFADRKRLKYILQDNKIGHNH